MPAHPFPHQHSSPEAPTQVFGVPLSEQPTPPQTPVEAFGWPYQRNPDAFVTMQYPVYGGSAPASTGRHSAGDSDAGAGRDATVILPRVEADATAMLSKVDLDVTRTDLVIVDPASMVKAGLDSARELTPAELSRELFPDRVDIDAHTGQVHLRHGNHIRIVREPNGTPLALAEAHSVSTSGRWMLINGKMFTMKSREGKVALTAFGTWEPRPEWLQRRRIERGKEGLLGGQALAATIESAGADLDHRAGRLIEAGVQPRLKRVSLAMGYGNFNHLNPAQQEEVRAVVRLIKASLKVARRERRDELRNGVDGGLDALEFRG